MNYLHAVHYLQATGHALSWLSDAMKCLTMSTEFVTSMVKI
jgi:hypothetical protein